MAECIICIIYDYIYSSVSGYIKHYSKWPLLRAVNEGLRVSVTNSYNFISFQYFTSMRKGATFIFKRLIITLCYGRYSMNCNYVHFHSSEKPVIYAQLGYNLYTCTEGGESDIMTVPVWSCIIHLREYNRVFPGDACMPSKTQNKEPHRSP